MTLVEGFIRLYMPESGLETHQHGCRVVNDEDCDCNIAIFRKREGVRIQATRAIPGLEAIYQCVDWPP